MTSIVARVAKFRSTVDYLNTQAKTDVIAELSNVLAFVRSQELIGEAETLLADTYHDAVLCQEKLAQVERDFIAQKAALKNAQHALDAARDANRNNTDERRITAQQNAENAFSAVQTEYKHLSVQLEARRNDLPRAQDLVNSARILGEQLRNMQAPETPGLNDVFAYMAETADTQQSVT